MNRKDILEQRQARLVAKVAELEARALASQDAEEVKSINAQIEDINADIDETRAELAAIEEESRAAEPVKVDEKIPEERQMKTLESFGNEEKRNENPLETMEYRQAFMAFVQTGAPIEARAGVAASTADTGAAIPLTVMREVINTVRKRYGNLYRKVRKLNVQGGVQIPVGALQATFKWINESTVSPRQKAGDLGRVVFGYNTLEIRIAQTFLASVVTLEAFEQKITEVIAEAYLQAMDLGIVAGSGDGTMTGILNDPRVTNTVTMTAAQIADWTQWRKRFFSQLPLGYRAGEFIFPLSTVESYLETMHDNNNNPIFRQATGLEVNDGDSQNPNGRFFGREISLVEPDVLPDFDAAQAGDVIGIFWQPIEYAINENFGFTMRRYFDEETNEWVDKALAIVDGKVLNPTGFYKIVKA